MDFQERLGKAQSDIPHQSLADTSMQSPDFAAAFQALTGNLPFPWQMALFKRFMADRADNIPSSCNLPTGLGKTSVIAVWLIALAYGQLKLPRRLVYVVNRRTVVDQTTNEVEKLRDNLKAHTDLHDLRERLPSLAISTLRGQFADNRQWRDDPSRPAVVVGTVDMIGSRLLFSGYGDGFKLKPLHAGFLGQDALLVHDEAHLEPAFQALLVAIQQEQQRAGEFRKFHVMELTATSRGQDAFGLKQPDYEHPEVKKRIEAKKTLTLHPLPDEKKLADTLADLALNYRDANVAVLVFGRTVETVQKVADKLHKAGQEVVILTGTMRGKERDELVENQVFRRFLSKSENAKETAYLVCTSAGEVGINISADHLVCDLATFDSMVQRFGRVNRFGDCKETDIHVVHPQEFGEDDYQGRLTKTLELLHQLNGDGSPKALGQFSAASRQDAFAPTPTILEVSDILFDSWALTSIRGKLPGRPPVEPYLHGVPDREAPETNVAWREDVTIFARTGHANQKLGDLLADYPLKPHELLRDRSDRVFKHIATLAKKHGLEPVWLLDDNGEVETITLQDLIAAKKQLSWLTVVLPPAVGGLDPKGILGHGAPLEKLDVADHLYVEGVQQRKRIWDDEEPPEGMRLIHTIDTKPEAEEADEEPTGRRYWYWYVRPESADDDGSKTAKNQVLWQHHTDDVVAQAQRMTAALLADCPNLQQALVLAAQFHDLGKKRELWQRSIGHKLPPNPQPEDWLAKSGVGMKLLDITDYRHEFGSLVDVSKEPTFQNLDEDTKDLVLHLIAAHHGRGRPHFPPNESFDPQPNGQDPTVLAAEVPQRFARLQRKFGRWGLAYLESLLRAADYGASAKPATTEDKQ